MNRSRESGWGISQATISGIENDRVRLGVERAKVLATASSLLSQSVVRLKCRSPPTSGVTRRGRGWEC